MNTVLNTVGDAIATLQVDSQTSKPPAGVTEVFKLLDTLNDNKNKKEGFKQPKGKSVIWQCIKFALILTIIMTVLNLGPVQKILDGMFKNQMVKLGVQALIFLIVAVVLLKKCTNIKEEQPVVQPQKA